jgi:hypothetical protein
MRSHLLIAALALAALAGPAAAAERTLTGPEIAQLLAGNTVDGAAAKGRSLQYFDASGSTTYVGPGEPPSQGRWRVEGDKYCSQWPPSDGWACYDVEGEPEASPPTITWIGASGTRYPGIVMAGRKL